MRTIHVEWRGRALAIEAMVDQTPEGRTRVRMFSAREVRPGGYVEPSRRETDGIAEAQARRECDHARTGQVFLADENSSPAEGQSATAFSGWSEADRTALARLVASCW